MGAIKSGFRISIYKDRTNGDKMFVKWEKKIIFFLFLLIDIVNKKGLTDLFVISRFECTDGIWCGQPLDLAHYLPDDCCHLLWHLYTWCWSPPKWSTSKRRESPGNILSKTTSSGMTNDEYTGLPILICTYQELKQQWMRVGINSGGGLTPNNILNMLTKHFPLICQGESQI